MTLDPSPFTPEGQEAVLRECVVKSLSDWGKALYHEYLQPDGIYRRFERVQVPDVNGRLMWAAFECPRVEGDEPYCLGPYVEWP